VAAVSAREDDARLNMRGGSFGSAVGDLRSGPSADLQIETVSLNDLLAAQGAPPTILSFRCRSIPKVVDS
jgi:hypothetical protein